MKARTTTSLVSSLVVLGILLFSAVVTSIGFSVMTSLLIMFGIEEQGGDPGAPIIMLASLLMICGVLSLVTATIMYVAREDYHKTFSATRSVLLFMVMYFPIHLVMWWSLPKSDTLELVLTILFFASFIPLFHAVAQTGINIYEFFRKQRRS